jgi:hypothetical protein
LRASLRFACGAAVAWLPFYLLVRAASAWTPHPAYFPDDAFYARLCLPDGLALYWHDFGLYRLFTILPYALLNRLVMRAALSPALLSLIAVAVATHVFVWACLRAGLSKRRGALLAGVMLGSPVLLETINFWSGTLNYALVLLLLAAQLRAGVWARRLTGEPSERPTGKPSERMESDRPERPRGELSRGLIVTVCGALLALLTYEIALPFILATSALYVRGWLGRLATIGISVVVALALVAALAAAGLYWPQRFKLAAEQLTSAASETMTTANTSAHANNSADATAHAMPSANTATSANMATSANTTTQGALTANTGTLQASAPPVAVPSSSALPVSASPASVPERARMYVSLLFSFMGTGLSSLWWWALVLALAGARFLSRRRSSESAWEGASVGRLPWSVLALAFAFALVACVGYLALTKSMNARYVAFLLIYGAATLAWTKGRVAGYALASLLLVQAAVAAGFPVHMRDVELAAEGRAVVSSPVQAGDLVSINGRLARASWAKRFHAPPPVDMLTQPLNPRACRYSVPCEECK